MARIKIKDLPKDMKISKDVMRKITGGGTGTGGIGSPPPTYFPPTTTGPADGANTTDPITTDPIVTGPIPAGRADSYDSYETMGTVTRVGKTRDDGLLP